MHSFTHLEDGGQLASRKLRSSVLKQVPWFCTSLLAPHDWWFDVGSFWVWDEFNVASPGILTEIQGAHTHGSSWTYMLELAVVSTQTCRLWAKSFTHSASRHIALKIPLTYVSAAGVSGMELVFVYHRVEEEDFRASVPWLDGVVVRWGETLVKATFFLETAGCWLLALVSFRPCRFGQITCGLAVVWSYGFLGTWKVWQNYAYLEVRLNCCLWSWSYVLP